MNEEERLQEIFGILEDIRGLSFRVDECGSALAEQKRRVADLSGAVRELSGLATGVERRSGELDRTLEKLKSLMDL